MGSIRNILPKIVLFAFVVMIAAYVASYIQPDEVIVENTDDAQPVNTEQYNKIKVDVKGAVKNPGVYELKENSTLEDAVNMAGGFSEDADILSVNRAMIIKNGSEIIIPYLHDNDELDNIINDILESDSHDKR